MPKMKLLSVKKNKTLIALILLLSLFSLNAKELSHQEFWDSYISETKNNLNNISDNRRSRKNFFRQWFTGPLITPSPITLSPKHPAIGLGLAQYYYYGNYDEEGRLYTSDFPKFWGTQYIVYPQFGITKKIGTEAFATLATNYNKNKCSTNFLDTIYRIGYQVSTDKLIKGNWVPDFRIIAQEIFPTGNYTNLDADLEGIDGTGQGSFQTGIYLAWQKGFKFDTPHAFNLAGAVGYLILSSAPVKGLNFYGGTPLSEGRVYPGNLISIFSSGEFEISKHIALAYDSNLRINLSGKYKSKYGQDSSVDPKQMVIFEFTPEIEITITEKVGFLIGPWISIAGQNSPAFVSAFVAFMALF